MKTNYWFNDGCSIMFSDSRGHLLKEFNDVPKHTVIKTLNRINELMINRGLNPYEIPDHIVDADAEFWDRMDEKFSIPTNKLLPKPKRKVVKP